MVRVPVYEGPALQPSPMVQFEAPAVQPMQDVAGKQIEQLGQGMSQFAQGVQSLGTAMMQKAQKDQDDLDRADSLRAFTDYKSKKLDRLYNEQNGYLRTKGDQAFGPNKLVVQKDMAGYREEVMRGLTSPSARMLFQQRADADDLATFTAMDGHAAEQRDKYVSAQETVYIESEVEDLKAMHSDPEFGNRMKALMETIAGSRLMRGQDPKVVQAAKDDAQGAVYAGVVDNLAGKDPAKALQSLNEFAKTGTLKAQYVVSKRAELERAVDEDVGEAAGYSIWDKTGGNESATRLELDRMRRNRELTPSQYKHALAATQTQANSQQQQRADAANQVFDSTINRLLQNPTMTLEDFTESERQLLENNNRWDDVVQFINSGRQFTDRGDVVKDAENYLTRVQSGDAEPMSETEFRRRFMHGMSEKTYDTYSRENNRMLAGAGGQGRGRGGQTGGLDIEKDDNLAMDLQQMLEKEGVEGFTGLAEGGLTAKLDATADGAATARSKAGAKLLRFRRYFDPLFERNLQAKQSYGEALQNAFNDVMKMGKGSDGKYDWERVPGTADKTIEYTVSGEAKAMSLGSFSDQEVQSATSMWEMQNPNSMAIGRGASPSELVQIMVNRRNQIRNATMLQRDAMPGVVTFEALAQHAQTIRPGKSVDEVRKDILGDVDDLTRGAFRDSGSPVRVHDIAVDQILQTAPWTGIPYAATNIYAEPNADAEDVVNNARGVSLAAANRYLQMLSGEQFDLSDSEPPVNKFMSMVDATTTADTIIDLVGGNYNVSSPFSDIRLMTMSDDERAMHLNNARQALAALESHAATGVDQASWERMEKDTGTWYKVGTSHRLAYSGSRRRIMRLRHIVDVMSTPDSQKWKALDPSPSLAVQEQLLQQPPATGFEQAGIEMPPPQERATIGIDAMQPLTAVQEQRLPPSQQLLVDQLRIVDRIEQGLMESSIDLPLFQKHTDPVKAENRHKNIADAMRSLLEDGDPKPAKTLLFEDAARSSTATWLYEQMLGVAKSIDRYQKFSEGPLPVQAAPDLTLQEMTRPGRVLVDGIAVQPMSPVEEGQMIGAVKAPKMPPQNRRVYNQLVTAYNTAISASTVDVGIHELPEYTRDYLQQIQRMVPQVVNGQLDEAKQFLGDSDQQQQMIKAISELGKRAYQSFSRVLSESGNGK